MIVRDRWRNVHFAHLPCYCCGREFVRICTGGCRIHHRHVHSRGRWWYFGSGDWRQPTNTVPTDMFVLNQSNARSLRTPRESSPLSLPPRYIHWARAYRKSVCIWSINSNCHTGIDTRAHTHTDLSIAAGGGGLPSEQEHTPCWVSQRSHTMSWH